MTSKDLYLSLKNMTEMLYVHYRRLAFLESKGLENTLEYNLTLKNIESIKRFESMLYMFVIDRVKKDKDTIVHILGYLCMNDTRLQLDDLIKNYSLVVFNDLSVDDIVSVRISSILFEIYLEYCNKTSNSEKYNEIFEAKRNKFFIDMLSKQIDDESFKPFRGIMCKAKYDYAFAYPMEAVDVETNIEFDAMIVVKNTNELLSFYEKLSKLNDNSINSPANARKILLTIPFVKACATQLLELDDDSVDAFMGMANITDNILGNKTDSGKQLFFKILEDAKRESDEYLGDDYSLKRKY